jgi:hypothetical protein
MLSSTGAPDFTSELASASAKVPDLLLGLRSVWPSSGMTVHRAGPPP